MQRDNKQNLLHQTLIRYSLYCRALNHTQAGEVSDPGSGKLRTRLIHGFPANLICTDV